MDLQEIECISCRLESVNSWILAQWMKSRIRTSLIFYNIARDHKDSPLLLVIIHSCSVVNDLSARLKTFYWTGVKNMTSVNHSNSIWKKWSISNNVSSNPNLMRNECQNISSWVAAVWKMYTLFCLMRTSKE